MKKNSFTIIALLLSLIFLPCSALFAKKSILIPLLPTDSLHGAISFNAVRVIDARIDKTNIGGYGTATKKQPFETTDSFSKVLTQFAASMMTTATERSDKELLIVVHNLVLRDMIREQPMISTILIDMDCYLGSNGSYVPALHLDSLYEMHIGGKVMVVMAGITSYLITDMITQVATAQPADNLPGSSIADILDAEKRIKERVPAYQQSPRKGIYYTFEQFINNTPAEDAFYHDHFYTGDTHVDRFYLSSPTRKKEKDLSDTTCFVVFDGEKWFRPYTANTFKEMKLTDGDFYYFGIAKGLKMDDYSSLAMVGMPYGLFGSLIASGIAYGIQENQKHKPAVYDDALFKMKMDPVTGKGKKLERVR